MRLMTRVLLLGLGVVALSIVGGALWIFVYSRDLPDMSTLTVFAPPQAAHVSDPCLPAASVAIPYESIGVNLRGALSAVEAREDDPSVLAEMYRGFTDHKAHATLSMQISRSMFCAPAKNLTRQAEEIRMAAQLERRFSRRELFTIFANRAWFGEGQVGVEAASQHFFQKSHANSKWERRHCWPV